MSLRRQPQSYPAISPIHSDEEGHSSSTLFLGRVRRARSNLTRQSNGRYVEPYAPFRCVSGDADDHCVVCVHHVANEVRVRHMPLEAWRQLCEDRHAEMQVGRPGRSSMHLMSPPAFSVLPSAYQDASHALQYSSDGAAALASEPLVFDYFVKPETRGCRIREEKHRNVLKYVQCKLTYSSSDLHRIEQEDRRCILAVERRRSFLKRYQQDLAARLQRDPLYVLASDVPDHLVPMFVLLSEDERRRAARAGRTAREAEAEAMEWGRRLLFPAQRAVDGYVVVTSGPYSMNDSEADDLYGDHDEAEAVDGAYTTSAYIPRSSSGDHTAAADYVVIETPPVANNTEARATVKKCCSQLHSQAKRGSREHIHIVPLQTRTNKEHALDRRVRHEPKTLNDNLHRKGCARADPSTPSPSSTPFVGQRRSRRTPIA